MRRHFFLVGAGVVIALMLVAGAARLIFSDHGPKGGQAAGPQAKAAAGRPGGAPRAAAVTAVPATVRVFMDRIEVLGVAKGRESVSITSSTMELVTRVRFRDGQSVQKGAVLVDLQSSEEDANITVARATLVQAKRQYDRWKELAGRGFAPRATVEQYQAQYEQAVANLSAAQSRKADRAIRAPFSGVVGISDIAPGALINPGTVIATLDDVSVMRVDFDIPDRYLSVIQQGENIVARPDALAGQQFSGRIAMLDTRINERTRTIRGRAEFANPDRRLKPGMLMRVGIDRAQRQGVAVPEAAVQFDANLSNVFVIVQREGKSVAELRPVSTGISEGGFIEITAGLKAGERVVGDGLNRVRAGQPVRVTGGTGGSGSRAAEAPA